METSTTGSIACPWIDFTCAFCMSLSIFFFCSLDLFSCANQGHMLLIKATYGNVESKWNCVYKYIFTLEEKTKSMNTQLHNTPEQRFIRTFLRCCSCASCV